MILAERPWEAASGGMQGPECPIARLRMCTARKADAGGKGSDVSCLILLLSALVMEEKSGNMCADLVVLR